jgi:uncharacterized glyoxalase superfamily protein PhnB
MKSTPPGWPRISVSVFYRDPKAAIDWLCRAFGFEAQLVVEGDDGAIHYSEVVYGGGMLMVGGEGGDRPGQAQMVSPRTVDGRNTQVLAVFVDDADAHCARARAAGAEIFRELEQNDYGDAYAVDRTYGARDLEGHMWFFMQRLRTPAAAKP